jgi:hypothetical protein
MGGTLTITGDNTANTVVINDNGANLPTFGGMPTGSPGATPDVGTTLALSVTCNGTTQTFPAAPSTTPSQLTSVVITMGKKNDNVTYNLTAGLRMNAVRSIAANLGKGNDTFSLVVGTTLVPNPMFPTSPTVLNGLEANSSLSVNVQGGAGNDFLSVNATKGFNIGPNAAAVFNLLGGTGDDNIAVNANATLNGPFTTTPGTSTTVPARAGSLTILVDGGGGNDGVFGLLNLAGGNTTATVNGGGGNDNIGLVANFDDTFVALEPPAFQNPTRITAFLNGGGGHNTCFHTANVSASHCKPDLIV